MTEPTTAAGRALLESYGLLSVSIFRKDPLMVGLLRKRILAIEQEAAAPTITGFANPDGSGAGNWAAPLEPPTVLLLDTPEAVERLARALHMALDSHDHEPIRICDALARDTIALLRPHDSDIDPRGRPAP